jgi:hypothetical protein
MSQPLISSLLVSALIAAAGSALAAPSDDARAHFQAVASGDLSTVMSAYADDARLEWIGGPLDGSYGTSETIRGAWRKFTGSQGPLKLTVDRLEESANPKGSTVSANVQFDGKASIKVRYILTYRNGKVVSETWQIDPGLVISAK